jgi:2,3-bisphosphoglycerate-dependent phosphoglycerate mutase
MRSGNREFVKMKLHIYIFRHGETYFNEEERFTGWMDSRLTPNGMNDAKKIAEKMKDKKFQISFKTHLSRSWDTLKQILKYHPECRKVITDDRMIERSYGILEGKFHRTIIAKYGEKQFNIWHRSYAVSPPRGESLKMVEKRVLSFIKDLMNLMKTERANVAISAHGNSMRPFRRYFEHLTVGEMMELENPHDDYFDYTVEFADKC